MITELRNLFRNRNINSSFYSQLFFKQPHIAFPKQKELLRVIVAFIALILEITHIIDHTDHFDIQFIKQFDSFDYVYKGEFLRSSHNHCTIDFEFLSQSDLDVASARRKIKYQIVQFLPIRLKQQLENQLRYHRTSQQCRLLLSISKRHCFQRTVIDYWLNQGWIRRIF